MNPYAVCSVIMNSGQTHSRLCVDMRYACVCVCVCTDQGRESERAFVRKDLIMFHVTRTLRCVWVYVYDKGECQKKQDLITYHVTHSLGCAWVYVYAYGYMYIIRESVRKSKI